MTQDETLIVIRDAIIELAEIMLTHTDPHRVRRLIERMKEISPEQE